MSASSGSGVNGALTPDRPKRRRRYRDNDEFRRLLTRLLRAYRRRVGDGDLVALADMVTLRDELDGHLLDAIVELRHEPWSYSWQQIADALGVSRQAAQQRWAKASGARRVGGQPGHLR